MKKYESVLLLKIPSCRYLDTLSEYESIKMKYQHTWSPMPSLALAALSAFFHRHNRYGYRLKAVDINLEGFVAPDVWDISLFPKSLEDCIKENQYDVLALSAQYMFNCRWVDLAVSLSRKYHPEAKIMLGGGYPTLFPERSLKDHDIDDAVISEGEATFLHILNRYNGYRDTVFEERFPFEGYATKNEAGEIVIIPQKQSSFINGEDIPPAMYHYLDNIGKYIQNMTVKTIPIEASRGCPFNCAYCTAPSLRTRKVRYKSADKFLAEIADIKNRYGKIQTLIVDDNVTSSKEWTVEFLTKFVDSGLNCQVVFDVLNMSVKFLDGEIIDLLIRAGLTMLTISVETGSQEMQKRINKNLDLNQVREIVKVIKSKNIFLHICWILGFPNETLEQLNETLNFARELKAHSNVFYIYRHFPGTKFFEDAVSQGLEKFDKYDLNFFDMSHASFAKSDLWDYKYLDQMGYDANIELNFFTHPYLDTDEWTAYIAENSQHLSDKMPDHVICHIMLGYVHKLRKDTAESQKLYSRAAALLENKELHHTFHKYLSWDHPIIRDFNQFMKERELSLSQS